MSFSQGRGGYVPPMVVDGLGRLTVSAGRLPSLTIDIARMALIPGMQAEGEGAMSWRGKNMNGASGPA